MIQLYENDAQDVVEVLGIVAAFHASLSDPLHPERRDLNPAFNKAFDDLERWTPADAPNDRKHQVAAERLTTIVSAIRAQRS